MRSCRALTLYVDRTQALTITHLDSQREGRLPEKMIDRDGVAGAQWGRDQPGEHTREQPRLNLPIHDNKNVRETVETIDLWFADSKSVG
jgi:hypothetical protein